MFFIFRASSKVGGMMNVEKELHRALSSSDKRQLESVYGRCYDEYHGLVAFVLRDYLKDARDVEDLVDETFLRFFSYENKGGVDSIKAFLVQTAKNLALDQLRKKEVVPLEEEDAATIDPMQSFLLDLHACLDEEEMNLLYDYYVYDRTAKDMAKERNCSVSAIRMQASRLKKKIRQRFGGKAHE